MNTQETRAIRELPCITTELRTSVYSEKQLFLILNFKNNSSKFAFRFYYKNDLIFATVFEAKL